MLRHLDLFSGIGGFALAARMVGGYETVAFCEIEPYCQAVLRKHWPGVPLFPDVAKLCRRVYDCDPEDDDGYVNCPRCRTEFGECACIGSDQFIDEVGAVDVVTAGFPCQDISLIGKGAGLLGEQSGLWFEALRIVRELEPRWLLLENVSALLSRGLPAILYGLNEVGYDAQWHVVPASAVGAPHRRERAWIVAHARSEGLEGYAGNGEAKRQAQPDRSTAPPSVLRGEHAARWWQSQPGISRVVDGVPAYVDRTKCTGNAIVPQVAAIFLQAIKEVSQ